MIYGYPSSEAQEIVIAAGAGLMIPRAIYSYEPTHLYYTVVVRRDGPTVLERPSAAASRRPVVAALWTCHRLDNPPSSRWLR
jgi:hypothetical protein